MGCDCSSSIQDDPDVMIQKQCVRPELTKVFAKYAKAGSMDVAAFQKLWKEVQKEDLSTAQVQKFFGQGKKAIDERALCVILASPDLNSILDDAKVQAKQDMTQSIAHYLMSSSHNTYLEGNQLTGNSSVEAYRKVLLAGGRCLELDLWDGSDGRPIIHHGYTLTSKILAEDVCDAIMQDGFKASPYPIVLSVESHLGEEQENKLADIFINKFGTKLFKPDANWNPSELPTLTQLKEKILLEGPIREKQTKLNDLIALFTHDVDLAADTDLSKGKGANGVISISERTLDSEIKNVQRRLQLHNATHLTRIYPKATRVGSSNFDANPAWNCGCQLVSLNWQTEEPEMWVHRAKFSMNAGSGYLLKPGWMLKDSQMPTKKTKYTIKVICGGNFPSTVTDTIDPYIKVRISGWESAEAKTQTISNNGTDPFWDKTLEFQFLEPSTEVIEFLLYDEDVTADDLTGHAVFPLTALKRGYRAIRLLNAKGAPIPNSFVLVHISIT